VVNARGYCRLCARQAHLVRPPHKSFDVAEANRHGQQLFIADLFRQKRPALTPAVGRPVPWPACYPVNHRQLLLFDADRDLPAGRRAGFPAPPLADLAAALDQVLTDHAARYGWGRSLQAATSIAIRIILSTQDTPGAPVKTSHVAAVTRTLAFGNLKAVTEILAEAGMLADDREPALEAWFSRRIARVADPMAEEVRLWFEVLRDGSTTPPRSRPRNIHTVRGKVTDVCPALHAWTTAGYRSLREITRQDVVAVLQAQPDRHRLTLTALRSLFRLLKARRIIFANPTTHLRGVPEQLNQPLPMDLQVLREAVNSDSPARAALATLVAFHALRCHQLRSLRLTDVRDGRLHLPQQDIPLAAPVREKLAAWLDNRARRWPNTINPYLFVTFYTAVRTSPVSNVWVIDTLGVSPQAIREDRILHEAQTSQGDIRRLCDLFGLTTSGARRYIGVTD
jgi:hypothetical protein